MPNNNNEETNVSVNETEATENLVPESNSVAEKTNGTEIEAAKTVNEESAAAEPSIFESVINTVTAAVETVAETVVDGVSAVVNAVIPDSAQPVEAQKHSKRAEKIGMVASDKMTKTVVVRVDRVVKHPMYRKYIKRRKKFMAHDELGSAIGDKVRIVETRPLSARKRWRVVEIIQKAER